jgi:hypothetical protein
VNSNDFVGLLKLKIWQAFLNEDEGLEPQTFGERPITIPIWRCCSFVQEEKLTLIS